MALLVTDPVDWKVDLATSDLVVPLQRVSGAEGVRQRVHILLRMIRGEWFTNQDVGMPWFEGQGVDENLVILGNPFNEELARNEARKIIESVEGVGEIERLVATFDRSTRAMRIEFRITTAFGDTVDDALSVEL